MKGKGSSVLHDAIGVSPASAPLTPWQKGQGYFIDVSFGGQVFDMQLDTGSSDMWLPETGLKCVGDRKEERTLESCGFGPLATNPFGNHSIANQNFNISYLDNTWATGILGYADVGIADITVERQEVALVNRANWEGDHTTSGLIGFGYPSMTQPFEGTDPTLDDPHTSKLHYKPWISNATDKGLIEPMFSLAIERGANGGGGHLALGGLPPVSVKGDWASTPLRMMNAETYSIQGATNFSYYAIVPDGYVLKGEKKKFIGHHNINKHPSTDFPIVVNSGSALNYLPPDIAKAVNELYDPPSEWVPERNAYGNFCDAKPPKFAVRIGGTDFSISSKDLVPGDVFGVNDPVTGRCVCQTGIQSAGENGLSILGASFLKNVVAVHDIGRSEMRFAARQKY